MYKIDTAYKALLQDILDNGVRKQTRNGEVLSVFGRQIRYSMKDGFPLLTTKKMHWKSIVTELMWFLQGRTDLKWLLDNNNTIWVGDTWVNYSKKIIANNLQLIPAIDLPKTKEEFINKIKTDDEFAKKWGELGPIYGAQWRSWKTFTYDDYANRPKWIEDNPIDQIANLINNLKTNPDSRRLMVNAWNVGELNSMVLPPCHYGFQVYTRELSLVERGEIFRNAYPEKTIDNFPNGKMDVKELRNIFDEANIPTRAISLMWNQRSVDTPLGLPFNIASYALLLEILGKVVNMVPDELIGNLGDTHIYTNQIDGVKEQLTREPYPLPKLNINTEFWMTETHECGVGPFTSDIDSLIKSFQINDFQLENYQSHPAIKMPLSN